MICLIKFQEKLLEPYIPKLCFHIFLSQAYKRHFLSFIFSKLCFYVFKPYFLESYFFKPYFISSLYFFDPDFALLALYLQNICFILATSVVRYKLKHVCWQIYKNNINGMKFVYKPIKIRTK